MMRNRYFISFGVTGEEKAEISTYCQQKKKFRTPADLARYAVWEYMNRNPLGPHRRSRKKDPGEI